MTPPVVILGLGVSGLGCALELTRRGVPFVAFEQESRPGGLARSEAVGGFRFDYGPHVVLGLPRELDGLVDELPGLELRACGGRSCVALGAGLERLVPVPFQQHLNYLALPVRLRLALELASSRRRNGASVNGHGPPTSPRGSGRIHELFLDGYERKRLRCDVEQMAPEWSDRVPPPSLPSLLRPRWMTRWLRAKSPEARFLYPRSGGIEALPRALAAGLPPETIHCGRTAVQIDQRARRLTLASGAPVDYEQLVISLPLPRIVELLKDPPASVREAAGSLVHTSIYVIGVGVEGDVPPWTLIRFPAAELAFYRLSFPSHYSADSAPDGQSAVVGEISHHPTRFPLTPLEARAAFRQGLARLGVVERGQPVLVERMHDIRYGQVVATHGTRERARHIVDYLQAASILPCGRYGLWKDMLMTHSILSGMEVARHIGDTYSPRRSASWEARSGGRGE